MQPHNSITERGRKASLQCTFLPAHEGGLSLAFTDDRNLILSIGTVYCYATRRNDLVIYVILGFAASRFGREDKGNGAK